MCQHSGAMVILVGMCCVVLVQDKWWATADNVINSSYSDRPVIITFLWVLVRQGWPLYIMYHYIIHHSIHHTIHHTYTNSVTYYCGYIAGNTNTSQQVPPFTMFVYVLGLLPYHFMHFRVVNKFYSNSQMPTLRRRGHLQYQTLQDSNFFSLEQGSLPSKVVFH